MAYRAVLETVIWGFKSPRNYFMKKQTKPFDKAFHDENDPTSRAVVKAFYKEQGIVLNDNPDIYGVDLISDLFNVEVERRLVWNDVDFPFEYVNVLERKEKFFKSRDTHYAIVSQDYLRIGIIEANDIMFEILTQRPTASANKFVQVGELFYKIHKSKFKWHLV